MENNIDIKDIWKQQEIPKINLNDIIDKANKYNRNEKTKTYFANIILALTSIFIIWVGVFFKPELISTKLGILLCISAMITYLYNINKNLKYYNAINIQTNIDDFLKDLVELKKQQHFIQTKLLNVYFLLLSLGLCLYLIEYTLKMPLIFGVASYSLTIGWIAFNWFYIRKKQIQKSNDKLNGLIEKVESIIND